MGSAGGRIEEEKENFEYSTLFICIGKRGGCLEGGQAVMEGGSDICEEYRCQFYLSLSLNAEMEEGRHL